MAKFKTISLRITEEEAHLIKMAHEYLEEHTIIKNVSDTKAIMLGFKLYWRSKLKGVGMIR